MALPDLSLAGTAYKAITEATWTSGEPPAGIFYPQSPLGNPPTEGEAETEYLLITFLGIDGVGEISGGFRGRDETLELIIVDTTKGGVETKRNALLATMQSGTPNARFNVTLPGGTSRDGCRLTRGGIKILKATFTIGTKICQWIRLDVRQMSTSN
jgi:hypothetical protein